MNEFRNYSVLDFVRSREKSNLCRFLFCAASKFSSDEVCEFFRRYASQHFDDEVTGLVIVYSRYIVHMVESTERRMFEICSDYARSEVLESSKCFPVEIHAGQRFFDEWHARKVDGDDESLKIDEIAKSSNDESSDDVRDLYRRLVDDFYCLCNELRSSRLISQATFLEKLDKLGSPRNRLLPDVKILKRLLDNPWGDNLKSFVENYRRGICVEELDDEVWPFARNQCPIVVQNDAKDL